MGIEMMDSDDSGDLTKDSGRKGKRLSSIQLAGKKYGKIHPSQIENGKIQGIIVKHSDYLKVLEDNDHLPDKKLTSGVKSGLTHRYNVEFGYTIEGKSGQYMVIKPYKDKFNSLMTTAQKELDKHLSPDVPDELRTGKNGNRFKCLKPDCSSNSHRFNSKIGTEHLEDTLKQFESDNS